METKPNTNIADKIIDGIKKTVVEMEELRVQVALGKAEAKDLFEDSKKKFNTYIHEAKLKFENAKDKATIEGQSIRMALESLQVQLALGKAETKEIFEEQSKKIFKSLNELENHIKKNETVNEYYTKFLMEIEKFKIKLEILKLRFELKKINAQEDFESKKSDFLHKLNEVKDKMKSKDEKSAGKWEHFTKEINEAYSHLKSAFIH